MNLSAAARRALLASPWGWIALGFGAGLAPRAPGTVASALALLPWWLLRDLSLATWIVILGAGFALGVIACDRANRILGTADHGALVWDEFIGQWIALLPALMLPGWWALVAFALFRLFDILKPWPVSWADRRVGGGLGVMLDDVLAGAMAAVVLWVSLLVVAALG